MARQRSIPTLHLQTERMNGGIYAQERFAPVAHIEHRGRAALGMVKALLPGADAQAPCTICTRKDAGF